MRKPDAVLEAAAGSSAATDAPVRLVCFALLLALVALAARIASMW